MLDPVQEKDNRATKKDIARPRHSPSPTPMPPRFPSSTLTPLRPKARSPHPGLNPILTDPRSPHEPLCSLTTIRSRRPASSTANMGGDGEVRADSDRGCASDGGFRFHANSDSDNGFSHRVLTSLMKLDAGRLWLC